MRMITVYSLGTLLSLVMINFFLDIVEQDRLLAADLIILTIDLTWYAMMIYLKCVSYWH